MTGHATRHHRLHRWGVLLPVALAGTAAFGVVASGAGRAWTSPLLLLVLAGSAAGLAVAGWRRRVEVTVTPDGVAMPVVTGRLPGGGARCDAGHTVLAVASSCGSGHRFPGRYRTGPAREPLTIRAGGAR